MTGNEAQDSAAADVGGSAAASSNIAGWLAEHASERGDAPAVKQGDVVLSYAELDAASARAAGWLASRGVGPGDRVSLIMPNVVYFPIVYYAILRLGAVVVPTNPLLKAAEISYVWQDSDCRTAVVFTLFADEAALAAKDTGSEVIVVAPGEFDQSLAAQEPAPEVAPRDGQDAAVILYTSGTTGRPKGAELSHHNIGSNVATSVQTLFRSSPDDVFFGGLPLFHSFGQTCAMNASIYSGSLMTLLPKFDPEEALQIVARDTVTIFLGVPTMYVALLGVPDKHRFDTSSLRLAVSGGASLPLEVLEGVQQAYDFKLLEGYGLSETSPVATFNHPDQPSKAGSIGYAIAGVEVRVVDADDNEVPVGEIGEIVIRGDNIMTGYLNQPEATAESMRGGWFHSGDLARVDSDGHLFIVDRLKDMIIRNGFNVYPREVEELLYTHPEVAEVAVLGIPDAQHGEEIAALVTVTESATVTEDELRSWAEQRIAAYKYPRIVKFGPIPKGPTGKILKRDIKIN